MKARRIEAIEIRSQEACQAAKTFADNFQLDIQEPTSIMVGNTLLNFTPPDCGKEAAEGPSGITVEVDDLEPAAKRLAQLGYKTTNGREQDGRPFILVDRKDTHGLDLKLCQVVPQGRCNR